jgi:hypothetical protein
MEKLDRIFYDGSPREAHDAIAHVERDAEIFLSNRLADFEKDDSAWQLLIDDLHVPTDLDEWTGATVAFGHSVQLVADELVVHLAHVFPLRLEAIFVAARTQPWCAGARLEKGKIIVQLARRDPALDDRIVGAIRASAQAVRASMHKGIAGLLAVIDPHGSSRITAGLDAGLRDLDVIEAAKIARVADLGSR